MLKPAGVDKIPSNKAEDTLLYSFLQHLQIPLEFYPEARALLADSSIMLGSRKAVRVCSAIVRVLKAHHFLAQPQYKVYKIAKELHVSASGAVYLFQ